MAPPLHHHGPSHAWQVQAVLWYLFYFASQVAVSPFLGAWFAKKGLSSQDLGLINALRPWISLPASFLWTGLADHLLAHRLVMIACFVVSGITRCALLWARGFVPVLMLMLFTEVLSSPVSVLADSAVVAACKENEYGSYRKWGAVGWGIMSFVAGWAIDYKGMGAAFSMQVLLSIPVVIVGWGLHQYQAAQLHLAKASNAAAANLRCAARYRRINVLEPVKEEEEEEEEEYDEDEEDEEAGASDDGEHMVSSSDNISNTCGLLGLSTGVNSSSLVNGMIGTVNSQTISAASAFDSPLKVHAKSDNTLQHRHGQLDLVGSLDQAVSVGVGGRGRGRGGSAGGGVPAEQAYRYEQRSDPGGMRLPDDNHQLSSGIELVNISSGAAAEGVEVQGKIERLGALQNGNGKASETAVPPQHRRHRRHQRQQASHTALTLQMLHPGQVNAPGPPGVQGAVQGELMPTLDNDHSTLEDTNRQVNLPVQGFGLLAETHIGSSGHGQTRRSSDSTSDGSDGGGAGNGHCSDGDDGCGDGGAVGSSMGRRRYRSTAGDANNYSAVGGGDASNSRSTVYVGEGEKVVHKAEEGHNRTLGPAGRLPANAPFWLRLKALLLERQVVVFLGMATLLGFGFGTIDTFLFVYLQQLGANDMLMGLTLTITCAAEVPVFQAQQWLMTRFSIDRLLDTVVVTYAVRMLAYASLPSWGSCWAVLPVEVLHGVTFGLGWGVGTTKCKRLAPPGLAATMQGMFQGCYFGLGYGIGSLIGGFISQRRGFPVMYLCGAMSMMVGWVMVGLGRLWAAKDIQSWMHGLRQFLNSCMPAAWFRHHSSASAAAATPHIAITRIGLGNTQYKRLEA